MTEKPSLRSKLNSETGRTRWSELEPHYRRGALVRVNASLDLVEVAARIAEDDTASVERWLSNGDLWRVTSVEAAEFRSHDRDFWAVVVAPWVLVQEEAPRC